MVPIGWTRVVDRQFEYSCAFWDHNPLRTPTRGTPKSIYTVSQKTCDYIFYNNFNNKCPITMIFGTVSSKSMRHRKMVSFPISPMYCNYLTLGNHRTQKNDQFRRKQHIVLWINHVLRHVWLLEASAETARHRSNTGRSPSPHGWQISVQPYPRVTRQRIP